MIDIKEVVPIGTTSLFLDVPYYIIKGTLLWALTPYYIYRGAGEEGKKKVVPGGTTSCGVLDS